MSTSRSRKRTRKFTFKRMFMGSVLAAAIAMGWLMRGCLGIGLGPGDGEGDPASSSVTTAADISQSAADAAPPPRASCRLRLSSKGLTLDKKPISIAKAVQECKSAKSVRLHATGGARSGAIDEVQQALKQAGIRIEDRVK